MPNILTFLLQNPLVVFFATTTIFLSWLFLIERGKKAEVSEKNRILYEQIQDQSAKVIQDALSKAQNILQQAAIEEGQLIEGSKQNVDKIEQLYSNFLATLQMKGEQTQQEVTDIIKQQTTVSLEKVEQTLADFLNQTQQQSIGTIQLEIQAARQLVDTYKRRQLATIDENIVAILENTMGQVLSKRLTLKDHIEMVYDALEKAKLERFII